MGYSKNPAVLRAIEKQLEPLARGQSCSWTITVGDADNWAYKVRQGLNIAAKHPHLFPGLARYSSYIKVTVVNSTLVQATVDSSGRGPIAMLNEPQSVVPMHGVVESSGPDRTLVSPHSPAEVIEQFIRAGASNDPFRVLETNFSDEQKSILMKFAQSLTPAWILLEPAPGALVIHPATPDVLKAAWKPTQPVT